MFARAIEIEPNYAKLRGQQIVVAFRGTRRREALELFHELKARYPLLDDYDGFGIQAYLICGEPQQSLDLLQRNTLPKQDAEQLLTQINAALEVKQEMLKLGEAVEKSQINEADLRELLEALHKVYPTDPHDSGESRKRFVPRRPIPARRGIIAGCWRRNFGRLDPLLWG